MNILAVIRAVSAILVLVGVAMLTAAPVGWLMGDPGEILSSILAASIITIVVGLAGVFIINQPGNVGFREGFGIVSFSWIVASLFGALPYVWGGHLGWVDAFFETMSGFTTTGSSILSETNPETGKFNLPYSLLYWRSLTQWLGGMGIVVLSLAIMPILGIGGMQLYKAEAPGPTTDQITPRIASAAKIFWVLYVGITILETILLLPVMSLFEAWCHSCTTISTGGFSTRGGSIGAFNSFYVEGIVMIFMFLGGINFALHLKAVMGKPLNYINDEEFRFYCGIIIVGIIFFSLSLYLNKHYEDIPSIIRHASFTSLTLITTTGFGTEDFNLWPAFCMVLMVVLMFSGGCGGSTSGSMKVSRSMLLLKYAIDLIRRCLFPRSVGNVRLNNQRVTTSILDPVLSFFFIFIALTALFTMAVCFVEPKINDITSAFTAAITCLGNVGPGLGQVGPTENFAWMGAQTKLLLSAAMLIGRLEIYTVIVLFLPSFWRK